MTKRTEIRRLLSGAVEIHQNAVDTDFREHITLKFEGALITVDQSSRTSGKWGVSQRLGATVALANLEDRRAIALAICPELATESLTA